MKPVPHSVTFRIDDDLRAAMDALYERDGIKASEQVRRALRMWLESKGVMKAERSRAATRKRP